MDRKSGRQHTGAVAETTRRKEKEVPHLFSFEKHHSVCLRLGRFLEVFHEVRDVIIVVVVASAHAPWHATLHHLHGVVAELSVQHHSSTTTNSSVKN